MIIILGIGIFAILCARRARVLCAVCSVPITATAAHHCHRPKISITYSRAVSPRAFIIDWITVSVAAACLRLLRLLLLAEAAAVVAA